MDEVTTNGAIGRAHDPGRPVAVLAIAVAVVGQLVVLVPFTVASGLVAPLWAIITLYLLWFASASVLFVTARRRPLVAPLVPAINAALLFGFITFGERVLGWTA